MDQAECSLVHHVDQLAGNISIFAGGGKINSFLEPITLDAHRCHYTQARWRKIPITLKPSMSAMAWFRKLTGPVLPKNR
jgi:hypothetical protein